MLAAYLADQRERIVLWPLARLNDRGEHGDGQRDDHREDDAHVDVLVRNEHDEARAREAAEQLRARTHTNALEAL